MDDRALRLLFGNPGSVQLPSNNDEMVKDIVRTRALRSQACIDAFRNVDRKHFWVRGSSDVVFADMPLRHGCLHISAPQIYAEALESLMPLNKGMSFLNVGSGTGYFNSVVSEMIGDVGCNHGIDIWPEALDHARERCLAVGKQSIEFFLGNVYELDVTNTMRYDRIYLGACANSRSKYLYRLLEVGGVLVGPFQVGRAQQLRRVVRRTETEFCVEVLESVRFASLVEPQSEEAQPPSRRESRSGSIGELSNVDCQQMGLPGVPFTFALREQLWSKERCWAYPTLFRSAVEVTLRGRANDESRCALPPEIWEQQVLPFCPKWWFEKSASLQRPAGQPEQDPVPASPEKLSQSCIEDAPLTPDADLPASASEANCIMAEACSDDGGSTRASSTQSTPEARPVPHPAWEADEGGEEARAQDLVEQAVDRTAWTLPDRPSNALVEVWRDGRWHEIGAEGDPDDEIDEEPDIDMQVLLAAARRAQRDQEEEQEEEDDQSDDDESSEGAADMQEDPGNVQEEDRGNEQEGGEEHNTPASDANEDEASSDAEDAQPE